MALSNLFRPSDGPKVAGGIQPDPPTLPGGGVGDLKKKTAPSPGCPWAGETGGETADDDDSTRLVPRHPNPQSRCSNGLSSNRNLHKLTLGVLGLLSLASNPVPSAKRTIQCPVSTFCCGQGATPLCPKVALKIQKNS